MTRYKAVGSLPARTVTRAHKVLVQTGAGTGLVSLEDAVAAVGAVSSIIDDESPVLALGGTTSQQINEKFAEAISVKDFGAVGDGVTDDWAALTAAIQSNRLVTIPPGDYLLSQTLNKSNLTNCIIFGHGARLTLAKNVNFSLLDFSNSVDVRITGLRFNHQRNFQTGGHCIRLSGGTRLKIDHIVIENAKQYGIGAQVGTFTDFTLSDVKLYNIGDDGIDLKNHNNDNTGIIYNNITVDTTNLNGDGGKTGIDMRGPAVITNVQIRNSNCGVRFRATDPSDLANGVGGHRSSLSNFVIVQSGSATGVSVDAENVAVTNGTIKGGACAYSSTENGFNAVVSNVIALDTGSNRAFEIKGEDTSVVNCVVDGGVNAFRFYTNGTADRCVAKNMTGKAFQIDAPATSVAITNCKQVSCVTPISDFSGVAQIFNSPTIGITRFNVKGLPTSASGLATGQVWNNSGVLTVAP